jgi:MYXO-CTERM domain-containing protein
VNCNAGPGWDGPTGWGTPSAAAMLGLDAGTFVPDAGEDGGSVSDASSGDGSATGDGGNTGDDGGPAGGGNPDGSAVDGGGGNGFGGPGGSSGCGCTTPSSSPLAPTGLSLVAIAGLVAISARRRRR